MGTMCLFQGSWIISSSQLPNEASGKPTRMMPTDLVAQQPTESGCPEDGGTEADPEELARLSGGHCRADEMLVSDPALGNVSPLSAGEEVKPRNAGHRRQSVTVTGRRLLPKSVTCLQPGSVKIEGVSSGKTESHAHKAEALSGSLQDGRTPTDRGSPPEEKPPAFGDEKGTVSRNRGQYEETPDRGLSTNLKGAPNSLEEGVFAKNKTRSIFQ
nr:T-complex protein 10A homolog 1 isoform X4 [Manis javanica]